MEIAGFISSGLERAERSCGFYCWDQTGRPPIEMSHNSKLRHQSKRAAAWAIAYRQPRLLLFGHSSY